MLNLVKLLVTCPHLKHVFTRQPIDRACLQEQVDVVFSGLCGPRHDAVVLYRALSDFVHQLANFHSISKKEVYLDSALDMVGQVRFYCLLSD